MRIALSIAFLLAGLAWAGDDEPTSHGDLGGSDAPATGGGMDDIHVDIDLGPSVETFTYEGDNNGTSEGKITSGAAISITNPTGNTVVRCADVEKIEASMHYRIDGTDKPQMESFGNSMKLAVWGTGASGGVKSIMGTQPSKVKSYQLDFKVNVPKTANVTITSSKGWIQATGCNGTVKATAGKGGAYVDGELKSFSVSASDGDVKVVVQGDGKIKSGAITASKGNATVIMPMAQDLNVDAKGKSVSVVQNVVGTVTSTAVTGKMGAGGGALTLRASGDVVVNTP